MLRRLEAAGAAQGLVMQTGVEPEFFLIAPDGQAIADAADRQTKPCYDQLTLMRRFDVIAEISDAMEALGWGPYQNDHEDANGQYEMNWAYAPAMLTADRHVFFKYMVRSIAERHGMRATFMPKPFADLTGSGCHAHVSVWQGEENVFEGGDALGLSALAHGFLGGLMAHAEGLCALTNPVVNSYKRINAPVTASGATWSPSTVSWGGNNRTPHGAGAGTGPDRVSLGRWGGEPLSAASGIVGRRVGRGSRAGVIRGRGSIGTCMRAGADAGVRRLPLNLLDAVRAFEGNAVLRGALGEAFSGSYAKLKRQEWDLYMRHLTQWERDTTLDC